MALVGPSGGGKSSCVNLLEHFYEAAQGHVLLDGVPIDQYDHRYLHTKVSRAMDFHSNLNPIKVNPIKSTCFFFKFNLRENLVTSPL